MDVQRVLSPKHQNIDEIKQNYWNNWLIVSEMTRHPRSGKVLFYCENRTKELEAILAALDEDPAANGYPDLMYVGPSRGFIGGIL